MIRIITSLLLFTSFYSYSQVVLRDTTLIWKHHDFTLNDDRSVMAYTTNDDEISTVSFQAKVIENNLIKLVVVPEYGGRVISFVYKPTGHEYLYQSECGSPYGMNDGNFYYDWLMVYGGIFPTFTEPEHGKAWLLPWKYEIVTNDSELVTLRMSLKDTIDYAAKPGKFNNGMTDITCQVDISVFANRSTWDFDVTLINNHSSTQNYEYWTCTTLTPGSKIGDTGSPLASKIVAPVDEYFAGWSPSAWIGGYGSVYDFADIDELGEWSDMGIAYANEIQDNYWGVINQENLEGIFRIADNSATPGLKLWTWGKGNVDNNLLDFSNGGADNYIELWAGTSREFFADAYLVSDETKSWTETYMATTNMTDIKAINGVCAMNFFWNSEDQSLVYEFNSFDDEANLKLTIFIENDVTLQKEMAFAELGIVGSTALESISVNGYYLVKAIITDEWDAQILNYEEEVYIDVNSPLETRDQHNLIVYSQNQNQIIVQGLPGEILVTDIQGRIIKQLDHVKETSVITVPQSGIYIVTMKQGTNVQSKKLLVR